MCAVVKLDLHSLAIIIDEALVAMLCCHYIQFELFIHINHISQSFILSLLSPMLQIA